MRTRYIGSRDRQPLDNDQLRRIAPAIFAEAARPDLSSRYAFLPTSSVVEGLRSAGWVPVHAAQGRSRNESAAGLQRHVVRFNHPDMKLAAQVGDTVPELALENSHDGTRSYLLSAALYRKACANGLMVCDGTLDAIRVRHTGAKIDDVVEASFQVIAEVPKLAASVEGMRAVTLSSDEQIILAESAASMRWEPDAMPVQPTALLTPRRSADTAHDIFTTLNVVQENIIRGGLRGKSTTGHRMTTRAVTSVTEDSKLNKALWALSERMRQLKTGAA